MSTQKSTAPAGTDTMQTLKHNQIISIEHKNVKNALVNGTEFNKEIYEK